MVRGVSTPSIRRERHEERRPRPFITSSVSLSRSGPTLSGTPLGPSSGRPAERSHHPVAPVALPRAGCRPLAANRAWVAQKGPTSGVAASTDGCHADRLGGDAERRPRFTRIAWELLREVEVELIGVVRGPTPCDVAVRRARGVEQHLDEARAFRGPAIDRAELWRRCG